MRHVARHLRPYVGMTVLAGALMVAMRDTPQAHSSCTTTLTYNRDIFPILRDRCGRCHVSGGVAPMSLLTFKDAQSWALAMRDQLTTRQMPPWYVDPASPPIKGEHPISAKEIDTVVTWASCNTPHGALDQALPVVTVTPQWRLGPPDLSLPMEREHTVAANTVEQTADISLPTGLAEAKWIKAVDLMPGTPSMVRDALISVDNGPVLAVWQPGNDPVTAPSGAAFRLPVGSPIHLRIHYKKSYLDEERTIADKSTIGLYFTDPPPSGRELQSLTIESPPDGLHASEPRTLRGSLTSAARLVALRPSLDQPYEVLEVTAVTPTGTRLSLLKLLGARPQWERRYWLQEPVELPAGSRIDVSLTPKASDEEPRAPRRDTLQLALDYVPQ